MISIELARTIQADKRRAIEAETRRRRLTEPADAMAVAGSLAATAARPSGAAQRPASTAALSR
jgi:hypothetical protein